VLGIIVIGAVRFGAQDPPPSVHYHANWAVFVDGQRLDLSGNRYMEEVFQCAVDPLAQTPVTRVHMHENNQDVVHVHAPGVAWGHLLANLGFGIGDDYLYTDSVHLQNDSVRTLKFVLNGAPIESIRNLQVKDKDRLLISYGSESIEAILATQYPQVASTAGEYDIKQDPASCSGTHEETMSERLRRAFWF
jgi:hypothetical protein